MAEYYVKKEGSGEARGPYSQEDIKRLASEGEISPTDFLSLDKVKWVPARKAKGLQFATTQKPTEQPVTLPEADHDIGPSDAQEVSDKKTTAGCLVLLGSFFMLFGGCMFIGGCVTKLQLAGLPSLPGMPDPAVRFMVMAVVSVIAGFVLTGIAAKLAGGAEYLGEAANSLKANVASVRKVGNMAHQISAWRYEGDVQAVAVAVDRAINKLKLNVKDRHDSHSRFSRVAAEKTNWLSTNWPLKVEVTGSVEGDSVLIEVEAKSAPSLTAGGNVDRKIGELIDLVKAYLPVN